MAKLDSLITFTGRLGNVIAYRRGGQHFLRSRPETVRQTLGTRKAAQWFGAASRKGALIRKVIVPDLDIHCGGSLVNRLNQRIVTAGRNNHGGVAGFQFNPYTGIEKFFPQLPAFFHDGQLQIPAQRIHAPSGATLLEVKLIASRIDFANRRVTGTDVAVQYIDPEQPFQGAAMFVDVPGKGMLVVTLQVRVCINGEVSCNRNYFAADILAVVEERTPERTIARTPRKKLFPPVPASEAAPLANRQAFIQRE